MIDLPHFCKKAHIFSQYKKYLRLYNKEKASFRNSSVHDAVVVKSGATDILKAKILHRSVRSYSHAIAKLNNYSDMLALDAFHKGKSVNILQLVFIFPLAFIKHFIFRRYFVYGIDGFINAMLYACIRLLKYAKIRELKKKNNG